MFPEFNFDCSESPEPGEKNAKLPAEESAQFEDWLMRRLKPAERERLERLLLQRLKEKKPELQSLLEEMSGHWHYEDHFYRYYHGSFKVYSTQNTTEKAVNLIRELLPES